MPGLREFPLRTSPRPVIEPVSDSSQVRGESRRLRSRRDRARRHLPFFSGHPSWRHRALARWARPWRTWAASPRRPRRTAERGDGAPGPPAGGTGAAPSLRCGHWGPRGRGWHRRPRGPGALAGEGEFRSRCPGRFPASDTPDSRPPGETGLRVSNLPAARHPGQYPGFGQGGGQAAAGLRSRQERQGRDSPRDGGDGASGGGVRSAPAGRPHVCSWRPARDYIDRAPRPGPPPARPQGLPRSARSPAPSALAESGPGTTSTRLQLVRCLLFYFSAACRSYCKAVRACAAFPAWACTRWAPRSARPRVHRPVGVPNTSVFTWIPCVVPKAVPRTRCLFFFKNFFLKI